MSAACSTCGCSTPVLPSGRCIICEGAFRAGQRTAYAACAAEARRLSNANQHQCGGRCPSHEPCIKSAQCDGADSALETLATWAERAGGE